MTRIDPNTMTPDELLAASGQAPTVHPNIPQPAHADPKAFASLIRTVQLAKTGYGWVPHQVLYAFADSGLPDADLTQQLDALKTVTLQGDQAAAYTQSVTHNKIKQQGQKETAGALSIIKQSNEEIKIGRQNNNVEMVRLARHKKTAAQSRVNNSYQQAVQRAKTLQGKSDSGFQTFFDDPVLQKAPSVGLALQRYVAGTLGPWPIEHKHLTQTQQALQLRGFGRDLPTDGVWNPAWEQAKNEWVNVLYDAQLKGDQPGSVPLGTAVQALNALMPVSAFDAITGFILNAPRDLLSHAVAGLAAGGSFLYNAATTGNIDQSVQQANVDQSNVVSTLETAAGHPITPEQFRARTPTQILSDLVQDVSTVMMLTSIAGAGTRFANAIGQSRQALTLAEAGQAGGVVTDTLGQAATHEPGWAMRTFIGKNAVDEAGNVIPGEIIRQRLGRVAVGTTLGGVGTQLVKHDANGLEILGGAVAGGLAGWVSGTQAFDTIPVLGRMGPTLDKIADADGLYYKTRNVIAAPYRWTVGGIQPVAAAGSAFQSATLLGAEARGLAAGQEALGLGTPTTAAIQNENTWDTINDQIRNRLDFNVLGVHIRPSLNDLQFVLHGVPGQSSAMVGHQVDSIIDTTDTALTHTGLYADIHRVTGMTTEQMLREVQKTYPEANLATLQNYWGNKYDEIAINAAALDQRNRVLQDAALPAEEGITDVRAQELRDAEHSIRNDPVEIARAREILASTPNLLYEKLHNEIAMAGKDPAHYVMENLGPYMQANGHVVDNILPELTGLNGVSDEPGTLGIAKLGTPTKPDILAAANLLDEHRQQLEARVAATTQYGVNRTNDLFAPGNPMPVRPEETNTLENAAADYLHAVANINADRMPQDLAGKIAKIREYADLAATPVTLNDAASTELHAAVNQLRDIGPGYKLVSGTDIGWHIDYSPLLNVVDKDLTRRRRFMEAFGLSPHIVDNRTPANIAQDNFIINVNSKIGDGKIVLPPLNDPRSILAYLHKDGVIADPAGAVKGALQRLTGSPTKFAEAHGYYTETGNLDIARATAEMNSYINVQALTFKQLREALSDRKLQGLMPEAMAYADRAGRAAIYAATGHNDMLISDQTIRELLDSIRTAYAKIPARFIGANHLETLFRASMGFAGRGLPQRMAAGALIGGAAALAADPTDPNLNREVAAALAGAGIAGLGGDRLGATIANLPNALINWRNKLRFEFDPMFSARRWFKVNVKLAAEGLPTTWSPYKAMVKAGTIRQDQDVLERVSGRTGLAEEMQLADDATLMARKQDVYSMFNQRNFEAYYAGMRARAGWTDDQIKDGLIHTFEYGTKGVSGRSPLERTANFFFFPFSFDKTLYRNLGGYLLDHDAQRIVLTRAMAEYDQFNKEHENGNNPLAAAFWTKHAPLANELWDLNAFAHGLSAGQPGGINRPLLNLFLPQVWTPNQDMQKKFLQFVPMFKELQRIFLKNASGQPGEIFQQAHIITAKAENVWHDLQGIPALQPVLGKSGPYTVAVPPKSTLAARDQIDAGFKMLDKATRDYQESIDWNLHHAKVDEKKKFPLDQQMWGRWAGKPITKGALRQMIEGYYPEFKASTATTKAIQATSDWEDYKTELAATNPTKAKAVTEFEDNANAVKRNQNNPTWKATHTAQDLAKDIDFVRQEAIRLAEKDSDFYALYNRKWDTILGPLEAVR